MKLKVFFLFLFLSVQFFGNLNIVEKHYLENSKRKLSYKREYFQVIEVLVLCELGKLKALSFLTFI